MTTSTENLWEIGQLLHKLRDYFIEIKYIGAQSSS